MEDPVISVATPRELDAILSLLLTSFRQFPLFHTLYSPLEADVGAAADTLFFWRRRLLLDLLDRECDVVVAQLPAAVAPTPDAELPLGVDCERSRAMLRWLRGTAGVTQEVEGGEARVVGFAIWRQRRDGAAGASTPARSAAVGEKLGWTSWAQRHWTTLELAFWKKVYARKDMDVAKYEAYLRGEEELSERFYQEACYQLDNLAVDFRFHRRGIGRLLVQWGLDRARELQLDASTEAGPIGEALYKKMGFREVGSWKLDLPGGEQIIMPVLRYGYQNAPE